MTTGGFAERSEEKEPPPHPSTVSEDKVEAEIDRDLEDSFPASDPPGWVLGIKPNCAYSPQKEQEPECRE